jgi:hypothetical protein
MYLTAGSAMATCNVTGSPPPGTVPCKVVVQPIDVCFEASVCAQFNVNPANPNDQNQMTNPIGFVDQATGIDITRAMLNQIGVDVTYLPIVQYDSMQFFTLSVLDDAENSTCHFPGGTITGFTSCDFLSLSQQPQISQDPTYVPMSPLGGPTQDPTVVNMFFVSELVPPTNQMGGTLYGFSWINNNGIAIGANTFSPPPFSTARFDTLAHELGHNLALTHTDFGADTQPNLMAVGGTPTGADFRNEPSSTSDAVTELNGGGGMGTADQLNLTSQESQSLPTSQQTEVLMSGLLRDVPDSTLMAMMPGSQVASAATGDVIAAAANAGDSFTAGDRPNSKTTIDFEVSGAISAGNPDESLTALILMLPKGLKFDPRNRFHAYFNPQYVAEVEILYAKEDHERDKESQFCVDPADFSQTSDDWNKHHRRAATQCLLIEFKRPGLQKDQIVRFRIGITIGGAPIIIDELAGGDVTFMFGSDTYATTSALTGPVSGQLMAGSQQPDLRIPSRYVDPSRVLATGSPPCTISLDTSVARRPAQTATTGCPDPRMTGIEDGDPSHEGGQPPRNPPPTLR